MSYPYTDEHIATWEELRDKYGIKKSGYGPGSLSYDRELIPNQINNHR